MKRTILISLFLIFQIVLAQNFLSAEIINSIIAVIVIGVFVLILLWLGGVIKGAPGRRLPIGLILFGIFLAILIFLPQFIPYPKILEVPASWKYYELPKPVKDAFAYLGIPQQWCWLPALIYLFIIPFAAIYTVVWAFLNELKIFGTSKTARNAYKVLAFLIAFSTIPMGYFVRIVQILFAINGIVAIVVFSAMFILGVFFRGYRYTAIEYYKIGLEKMAALKEKASKEISALKDRMDKLTEELLREELQSFLERYRSIPEVVGILGSKTSIEGLNKDQLKEKINQLAEALK